MPMQVLRNSRMFVAGFTGLSYMMNSMGIAFPRFWQGILFLGFYSSLSEVSHLSTDSFQCPGDVWNCLFCRGVYVGIGERRRLEEIQTADIECPGCQHRGSQGASPCILILLATPDRRLLIQRMKPKSEEPIEFRTVHPAPPASTKVHGKTYTLQTITESLSGQS